MNAPRPLAIFFYLVNPECNENGEYDVAISVSKMVGDVEMVRIVRREATIDEILEACDNPYEPGLQDGR